MVDILLVQPPIRDFYLTAKRTFPAGLASIGAALRQAGFTVAILDALATHRRRIKPLPKALEDLAPLYGPPDQSPFALFSSWAHHGLGFDTVGKRAAAAAPQLVGVSALFTAYADEARAVTEAIRRHLPGVPVVVGGHHATAMPADVLAWPAVDFVIRGDGEDAMVTLAGALFKGQGPICGPGIVTRKDAPAPPAGNAALVSDLDRLPAPALDLVPRKAYRRAGVDALQVTASRGCPFGCSYCAFGTPNAPPYRRRSVASVLGEIDAARQSGRVGFIDFEDENLTLDRGWCLELLAGLRHRFAPGSVELRAMNGLMPSTLDAGLIQAMHDAGFTTLNLSLGTAIPRRARFFRRPDLRRAFDRVLATATDLGMETVGYIIVGAPAQPCAESLGDLLYLAVRPVLAGVSVFYPVPGTLDYERCARMGLLPVSTARMRASTLPVAQRSETLTLLRLARLLNFAKSLVDQGEALPAPAPLPAGPIAGGADRRDLGRRLLAAFFHDGKLRGVDRQGNWWYHHTDQRSATLFARAMRQVPIRGSGRKISP